MNLNFTKQFKSNFKNKLKVTTTLIVTMLITGNIAMAVKKDNVYDRLKDATQDSNRNQIITTLDVYQNTLGIDQSLRNLYYSNGDTEKAIAELSGEIYGSLISNYIQTNKMFNRKIVTMMSDPITLSQERLDDFALRSTAELFSNEFTPRPKYSFLEGQKKYIQHFDILGTSGKFDETDLEYDTLGYGFVGITEKITGEKSSMGLSYGYYDTKNDYDDSSDSETKTYHLGMTQKSYFGKDYMIASHLGVEYSKNDVTRELTTLGLQANSDYDSYSVNIGTGLDKNIRLNEKMTLVPSIGFNYSRIERENFTESGSIGLAGLEVESQGLDSVTSKIGLKLDVDLTDKIVYFVGGSWEHEYADLNEDQEASFIGDANSDSFIIEGVNLDKDIYSVLTGVNFNVNNSITYRILYSFTKQDSFSENKIDLGVSWKF